RQSGLSSPSVTQWTGRHLQNAPGRWIDDFENTNPFNAEAECGKEQRKDSPTHTVIEIIDETGLRCGKQIPIAKRCEGKDIPEAYARSGLLGALDFESDMIPRVAD